MPISQEISLNLSKVNVWSFTFHCCIIKRSSRVEFTSSFFFFFLKIPCCACAKACGPSVELQLLFELAELLTRVILSLSLPSACRKSWEDLTYWRRRPRDSQLVVVVGSERTDEQTTPRDWEKAEAALYSSWNAQLSLTPRLEKVTREREREVFYFAFLAASYCERRRSLSRRCAVPCINS